MQTIQLKRVRLEELRDNLSARDYELLRKTVVARCMITSATWSNWVNGKVVPAMKYRTVINTFAANFGITVFTPEGEEGGGE